jgi:phosphoribosylformimino-5-aminoimidazole carboxamide ribotide isomerase
MTLTLIPAIDLLDGKAVRLTRGVREQATVYSERPIDLVRSFIEEGASRIHVVDLDGAFAGSRQHSDLVAELCAASSVPVQVGGGIRDVEALEQCFADGASYAVLGTAAIKSPELVEASCKSHPGQVIVAVDAVGGMVAVEGWVETSELSAVTVGQRAASWGAAALLYTDVSRDGTHAGPNVAATEELARRCEIPVIASGGIASLGDIGDLRDAGIPMAVCGRALYDQHFTLGEALAVARQKA